MAKIATGRAAGESGRVAGRFREPSRHPRRRALSESVAGAALRAATAALGLLLVAGCANTPDLKQVSLPLPKPAPAAPEQTAAQREHARILASYGGQYDDARVQALVEKTIGRLVAASERPDLTYKVTILNSGAVNAFALPTGQCAR